MDWDKSVVTDITRSFPVAEGITAISRWLSEATPPDAIPE
jgi:hypothetical protein